MEKTKLPAIIEYIDNYYPDQDYTNFSLEQVKRMLLGFGKLCAKVALEKAAENIRVDIDEFGNVKGYEDKMKNSILNAFDLNEIK